jgi:3-isopropylmalate/(R)-2-methylmalate dehydratase small subunit
MGLLILECEEADQFATGDKLEVDFDQGTIMHARTGSTYKTKPVPPFMQELVESGGLIEHIKKKRL